MSVDQGSCNHQIVYYGVTNINYEKKTIGSVDIWRCVICKKHFCEEKQLGIETIVDYVGMPQINLDQKWSVLICELKKHKEKWKLVKIKKDDFKDDTFRVELVKANGMLSFRSKKKHLTSTSLHKPKPKPRSRLRRKVPAA